MVLFCALWFQTELDIELARFHFIRLNSMCICMLKKKKAKNSEIGGKINQNPQHIIKGRSMFWVFSLLICYTLLLFYLKIHLERFNLLFFPASGHLLLLPNQNHVSGGELFDVFG